MSVGVIIEIDAPPCVRFVGNRALVSSQNVCTKWLAASTCYPSIVG